VSFPAELPVFPTVTGRVVFRAYNEDPVPEELFQMPEGYSKVRRTHQQQQQKDKHHEEQKKLLQEVEQKA
jgi:hypothetical protein